MKSSNGTLASQRNDSHTRKFDFARRWRKDVAPWLNDPLVKYALGIGLQQHDPNYVLGVTPPWHCGRGPSNGQRARQGCLSWYQPWGRCHHIAPFCWALGTRIYPELKWGFISGDLHTLVVGWSNDWRTPHWVMDILLFQINSWQESLAFAMQKNGQFYPSLETYLASFTTPQPDPQSIRMTKELIIAMSGVAETNGREEAAIHGQDAQCPDAGGGSPATRRNDQGKEPTDSSCRSPDSHPTT